MPHNTIIKNDDFFSDLPLDLKESSRIKVELSKIIFDRRNELGLSQTDLAKKLNVSQSMISQWEYAEANLNINTIIKILTSMGLRLNISVEEIETKNSVAQAITTQYVTDSSSLEVAEDETLPSDTFKKYIINRDSKPLYSIAEIKQTLSPIFAKHKVKKATLFGSYVKGTATTRSDIDLVVETSLEGLAFFGLLNDVSEALRFPVDLIEKREIQKGSKIEQEIFNTGVIIYE